MVILRGTTLRHLKILLRHGRVLTHGCASCERLMAQLGPDAEPVPAPSGQPLTDDQVHGRVDWEARGTVPFAGDARDIAGMRTETYDQLHGPAVCDECGCGAWTHLGTCSRSLMRGGPG